MDIEVFVMCDAATDTAGKLNILGTFDTIAGAKLPIVHPHCAIAMRIRFNRIEEGPHRVRINITDADGRIVMPGLDGNLQIRFRPDDQSAVANLVLQIDRLKFDQPGEHSINLAIDGRQERALPLFIRLRERPTPPPDQSTGNRES